MLTFDNQNLHFLVNNEPVLLTQQEINEMNSLEWWHSIPFAPGIVSKGLALGTDFITPYYLDTIDFKNKSVLDIGCWDGFQLFYAEAHGASRVVGVDDLSQRHMGDRARMFAKEKLRSRVEFVDISVYDLCPKYLGGFDIVMMFGVLYHLVHPMLGIEKACSVCKEEFLLSTHFVQTDTDVPLCLLYPTNELAEDKTNWSGPNRSWILKALEIQGFSVEKDQQYHGDRIAVYARRQANQHSKNRMLNASRDDTLMKK
jgi:tRNA (mo5U34)-methyltransferase